MDDSAVAINLRQSLLKTLEVVGQPRVVQPQQMQNRRVQIADLNATFHGAESKFIGSTVDRATTDTPARHPCRVAIRIVIATG